LSGISPIAISALALAIGLFASFAAYNHYYAAALGLWLFNRILDGLDGLIARLHDKQSDFGGYVDILGDFVIYAALPLGLVAGSPTIEHYLALSILLAVFYVNTASWMYLAAILEKRAIRDSKCQTTIVMPAGLVGGFESIIAYSVFLLFPARIIWLFSIFAALVFVTTLQRLIWAKRNLT
jgi:phosphatidylglycerophosphate synthase